MNDHKTQDDAKLSNAETLELLELASLLEESLQVDNVLFLHQGISYWTAYEAKVVKVLELVKNTKNLNYRAEYMAVQNATLEMIRFNRKFLEDILAIRQ